MDREEKGNFYSIIIPTYNSSGFIGNVISNLIYKFEALKINYEIIIIDDNSTDNTFIVLNKILQEHNNLSIIQTNKIIGQYKTTNIGIEKSKGNIILTCDDDEINMADYFSELIEKFNKNVSIIYGVVPNDIGSMGRLRILINPIIKFNIKLYKLYNIVNQTGRISSIRIFYKNDFPIKNSSKPLDVLVSENVEPNKIQFVKLKKSHKTGKREPRYRGKFRDALFFFLHPLYYFSFGTLIALFLAFTVLYSKFLFVISLILFTFIFLFLLIEYRIHHQNSSKHISQINQK